MKNKTGFYWGKVLLNYPAVNAPTEVKALIYGDSGLCINQFDVTKNKPGPYVSISHIKTGCRITSSFYDSTTARFFCAALSGLINWNAIETVQDMQKYPTIGEDVQALRRLVVIHKANWKMAMVIWKLTGEVLTL